MYTLLSLTNLNAYLYINSSFIHLIGFIVLALRICFDGTMDLFEHVL